MKNAATRTQKQPNLMTTIKLSPRDRSFVDKTAERYQTTVSAVLRMAIDLLRVHERIDIYIRHSISENERFDTYRDFSAHLDERRRGSGIHLQAVNLGDPIGLESAEQEIRRCVADAVRDYSHSMADFESWENLILKRTEYYMPPSWRSSFGLGLPIKNNTDADLAGRGVGEVRSKTPDSDQIDQEGGAKIE